jgi:hypothetical protein
VTDSDGTTVLSHWLEGIDAANSQVFILAKIPAVASGATRTVYLYYGNPSASSVSSAAATIGPTTSLAGPADIYTQVDSANFNANPLLLRLRNQGGANGGGAGLNGKVLCFLLSGANSNADRTNGDLSLMSSTDGGVTWGSKTALASSNATNTIEPRSAIEKADGTILLVYSCDTPTVSNVGKAKMYVAKSTDGGSTWSNLSSTSPANQLSVWWTYGTDLGAVYGRMIEKTAGGDLYVPAYALVGTAYSARLLKCPSGSDPTVGSNWVTQCTIATGSTSTVGYSETSVVQTTDSTHYLAISRNDATSGASNNGDLYLTTFTDSGTILSGPTRLGLPGTVGATSNAASPEVITLASGNLLLCWGVRYGDNWGAAAAISTDGGATWLDRSPALFNSNVAQTTGDGGYPSAVQVADGTICIAYYREVGGVVATCNLARVVCTEDYVANCNNVYRDCESSTGWTLGANATVQSTTKHSGTNAFKLDNSAGINPYAYSSVWPTNSALTPTKFAISAWRDDTGVATAANTMTVIDSTATAQGVAATCRRVHTGVWSTPFHVEWFNGTAWTDTGTAVPLSRWDKHTLKASVAIGAVTATGQYLLNNASVTTAVGGYTGGSTSYPQSIHFLAASTGSTHANTFHVDDVYTHQYTPTTPTVSAGTEASGGGFVIRTRSAMSGGFSGGK